MRKVIKSSIARAQLTSKGKHHQESAKRRFVTDTKFQHCDDNLKNNANSGSNSNSNENDSNIDRRSGKQRENN